MTGGPRLIIIGLDGASFNYLDPILESGRLPNFEKFLNSGVKAPCLSTVPPLTPPAWSTMLTGVNPGKHGIFDFIQPDSNGLFRMVDAACRSRKSFLDHAGSAEIRTISLLVPYTFPPDPEMKGLMISGLGTPSAESDFIRPHSLRDPLLERFPYLKETDPTRGRSIETLHSSLLQHTNRTADLARFAMSELSDWGICFTVFQATDLIPHFYCRYFDPAHPDYDAADQSVPQAFRDSLTAVYRSIDEFLGESMNLAVKGGGWVILVSDHGSQPLMGSIGKDAFLTRWLEDEGYLATGGAISKAEHIARAKAGSVANRMLYLVKRHTPHGMRDLLNRMMGARKKAVESALTAIPFLDGINWQETMAFCAPGGYGSGLYINRQGDFPGGVVPKGASYFNLREEIRSKLSSLEIVPGVPLFTKVLPREEALWGPKVGLAPDLLLLWAEDRRIRENAFRLVDGRTLDPPSKKEGTSLTWCGTHRMEGLFGIFGDGVVKGGRLGRPVNLADIMPTIHLVAGLPVPMDIDGRAVEKAFEPAFLIDNPPIEGPPEGDSGRSDAGVVSIDESDKLIDLLSGLGYLH
jgi:predicted AlkP superfamily phosphohydrolase/phosphomutase